MATSHDEVVAFHRFCALCGASLTIDRPGLYVHDRDSSRPMCIDCFITGAPCQPEFPITLMALLLIGAVVVAIHAVLS